MRLLSPHKSLAEEQQERIDHLKQIRKEYSDWFRNQPERDLTHNHGRIDSKKINDYYEQKLLNPE